jgi:hypothetical protein
VTRKYHAWANSEPPDICEKCGQLHYKETVDGVWRQTCVGHHTGDKQPCQNFPIKGGTVCRMHGGSTRRAREMADARWEQHEATRKVTRGLTSAGVELKDADPIKELLWAVAVSSQAVKWLGYQVATLHLPDLEASPELQDLEGVDEEGNPRVGSARGQLYTVFDDGSSNTHPLWKQWNAERQRHARFAKLAVDAGVSERMVRIAEAQSEMVVDVIMSTFDQLRISQDLKDQAVAIIAARFREFDAEMAPLSMVAGG